MEDIKYWLWLNSIEGVGPVLIKKLISYFKSPENIWDTKIHELLKVDGLGQILAKKILMSRDKYDLDSELNKLEKHNVEIITLKNKLYPKLLKNIYDPPPLLYFKGTLCADENLVAIVGSRDASHYGLKIAYEIAYELAKRGITVVSGMARGIDTAAHKGALDGKGRTIAVLGCGLDIVYPRENKELMNTIFHKGAVISEFPIGAQPNAQHFPQRNRVVSGISNGVVVVEANIKSGSLITADFALEQNREVFAVPGQITSNQSGGTNNLIKQGAKIVTTVEDILEELNIENNNKLVAINDEVKYNLGNDEKVIYSSISNLPIHLDNIIKNTNFTINKLNTIITLLELKGIIKQLPGKQFVRN